ncbi:ABC-type branched-chain amino acid transport systems, ATPase component [Halovivax ruber XH-70]|uniref:ABC-type branched-chain amino acid transport systems, ATPase component n=1 Tax=Halovivax ruber (strain DSM 18193 / JCM 13892 / XH-70) TaxID=797302 RepID=L0IGS3_HALRX|nr:ABC transporter ATP-binding protein [Halovivax ruber]AGB17416.1 ABC-type branched-chain amino acid transport systems, ATPase component [Halovivax ruber XH-70]
MGETTAREPLLAVEGVDFSYGRARVLRDVSLSVEPGELVALLGSNGAGKTTLLENVSGLSTPDSGAIRFDGEDVTSLAANETWERGLVHVPEDRKLFPEMTIAETFAIATPRGLDDDTVSSLRERVFEIFPDLESRLDQRVGTMSGGQQQMVSMSRGLMSDPDMLLLDEPTLGLAPDLAADILDAIGRINEAGTTVLLVSQQALSALDIADRAYVLDNGEVTLSGPATELKRSDEVREAYLGM